MIKSLTVTNPNNNSIVLELTRPQASGLIVQNIEGLGPAKANINVTDLASIDGSLFSSSRINERNIVITLQMMFFPTIEASRILTYKYFPIKKPVKLRIKTDYREAETIGYVETHEPVIFSKEQTTQISLICPDPFFYEIGSSETTFANVESLFEFPFSNESLTEDLIEFGKIHLDTRAILYYAGDVDTGITINIHSFGPSSSITIYNVNTHESMSIDSLRIAALTGMPFDYGDSIIISTIRGQRYARLLRNGLYTNIISAMGKDSDWFQIINGDNIFTFTVDGGSERDIVMSIEHRNAYGGI